MNLERAREILLDHARRPRNQATGLNHIGQIFGESQNPVCGDRVRVYLQIENSRITACSLHVQGCTMCTASASVMSENIRGLSPEQAQNLRKNFSEAVMSTEADEWPVSLSDFSAFAHLRVNRARIPCALIPWFALKEALKVPASFFAP